MENFTFFVPSGSQNCPSTQNNSLYTLDINLMINGLNQILPDSSSYIIHCKNLSTLSEIWPLIYNKTNTAVLGLQGIGSEVFKKSMITSVPTTTLYFQAINFKMTLAEDSFYSFLGYILSNIIFWVIILIVFFLGTYLYYCEKKCNMNFKKEFLVGSTLGMWSIYQLIYRKCTNIQSISGRILNMVLVWFFTFFILYLFSLLINDRFYGILMKRTSHSQFWEFSKVLVYENYKDYFHNYDFFIKTYKQERNYTYLIEFLRANQDYILIADILTTRMIFNISCDFQVISTNFRHVNNFIMMYNNAVNMESMKLINKAILAAKNNSNYNSLLKKEGLYSSQCRCNNIVFSSFYSTINEIVSITYQNLIDVIILTSVGVGLGLIAVIFSRKAVVYFNKKKRVKIQMKELNSSENRLLQNTSIFFKKQKEKTLKILEKLENNLKIFQSKEEKVLEYLESIHEWQENCGYNVPLNKKI